MSSVIPWFSGARYAQTSAEMLVAAADEAVETRTSWTFEDLFPTLPGTHRVRHDKVSVRLGNVLDREHAHDFLAVGPMRLGDVMSWRNLGAKSVAELLTGLIAAALEHHPEHIGDSTSTSMSRRPRAERTTATTATAQTLEDLHAVAQWRHWRGAGADRLLDLNQDEGGTLPAEIAAALGRLRSLAADDLITPSDVGIAELVAVRLNAFGDRDLDIIVSRIGSPQRETLDAIGERWAVTRERVRQLESKLKAELSSWVTDGSELALRFAAFRAGLLPVAHIDDVRASIPGLDGRVIDERIEAWQLIDSVDDGFESDGTWVAAQSLQDAIDRAHLELESVASEEGALSLESVTAVFAEWPSLAPSRLSHWLERIGCSPLGEGWALPGQRSLPDRAAAYLSLRGARAEADEILSTAAPDRSIGSLKNALASDPRFRRVDRNAWELASWGGQAYSGIKQRLRDVIDANGGQIALSEAVELIVGDFSVSEMSVKTYASQWPFVSERGIVRMASVPTARKRRERGRGVYVGLDSIRYRLVVNGEHLRGSGSPVPIALPIALGLVEGAIREYADAGFSVRWTQAQPALSSIRSVVKSLDASEGDHIVLDFRPGGVVAWKHLGRTVHELLGLTEGPASPEAIKTALGLADDVTDAGIESALRARNELDLLQAFQAQPRERRAPVDQSAAAISSG